MGENVSSSGSLKADNVNGDGGEIELHARDTTLLTEDSLTSARSEANGQGGIIKVLGDKVGMTDQAVIDVSGANGGGTALIGGDQEGKNPLIHNANYLYLGDNTRIKVDALDKGDGGKLIAFAADSARIYSKLSARGGINGGNGGFIETSGLIGFDLIGAPDVSAVAGIGGEWLIDPYNITITTTATNPAIDKPDVLTFEAVATGANVDVKDIKKVLKDNGNVTIKTSAAGDSGTEAGDIIWNASLDYNGIGNTSANRTLTLQADGSITFGNNKSIHDGADGNENLSVNLYAKGAVILNQGVEIETRGGNFTVGKTGYIPTYFEQGGNSATINTQGSNAIGDGNVTITTQGANPLNVGVGVNLGTINTGIGNLTVTASGGSITQSLDKTRHLNVNGLTTLSALGRNINLTNTSNDFNKLNILSATASIHDVNQINLGTSTLTLTGAGNALTVITTDGNIAQLADSTITVSNGNANVHLTAGGNGNIVQGSNARLINNGTGSLTTLTATDDLITLDNVGNDFTRVTADAKNITLRDANNIELGAFANSQDSASLMVTTVNGTITQAEKINYTGANTNISLTAGGIGNDIRQNTNMNLINNGNNALTTLTATDTITLIELTNDFDRISVDSTRSNLVGANNIELDTSTIRDSLQVTALGNGNITQVGKISNATGTTTLIAAGNDITLSNDANDFSTVVFTGARNVRLHDANDITLAGASITGTLDVVTKGTGNIDQTGALEITGTTTLDAGNDITLNNDANDFSTIVLTDANNVRLHDANNITLAGANITGSLDVVANGTGNIEQTGALKIAGITTLDAGNNITLSNGANDFNSLRITQAAVANIVDTNSINLGTSTIQNALNITSGGDITNTGGAITLNDTATALFKAGDNGSIRLTDAGNRFTQPVSLSASSGTLNNVAITNTVATQVNVANNIAGDLNIISNGDITSGSALVVGGTTTLSANNHNITLTNASNNFNILNVDAANRVDITDIDDIEIGSIHANTVNVDAGQIALGQVTANQTTLTANNGQITDNNGSAMNIIGDTATLTAKNGVGAGDPLETQLSNLSIANTSGEIGIHNTGNVTARMTTSGDIKFTNVGDVHIDLLDGIAHGDSHSLMELTVTNGSVFSAVANTPPDISGHDVTVIVNEGEGNFGEVGRPIYLDIHGTFTLLANISSYDFYGAIPDNIIDNSTIKLSVGSLFSVLPNQQMIEVESLFDLDPAIFTAVTNYYHDDLAIMMPEDQLYTEEELDERRHRMSER